MSDVPQRRDTSLRLSDDARSLIEALDLELPTASEPGFWKTADGFLAVNGGVVRMDYHSGDRLRALIKFEGNDIKSLAMAKAAEEFGDYDELPIEGRRSAWARILQISKQLRTDRVADIIRALDAEGIDVPAHNIVVNRVSNTFYATVDVEILQALLALRAQGGCDRLRKILIDAVTQF